METTSEHHNQPKCRVVRPSPNWHIYNKTSTLRLRENYGGGDGKTVRARGSGSWLQDCASWNIRSYSHKLSPTWLPNQELNKDEAKLKCQTGWRKDHKASSLHKEGNWENLRRKRWPSPGKNTQIGCLVPNGQPLKHLQVSLNRLKRLFLGRDLYIYIHVHATNTEW